MKQKQRHVQATCNAIRESLLRGKTVITPLKLENGQIFSDYRYKF